MVTSRFRISSACRLRSSSEIRCWSSILSSSLGNSSDSGDLPGPKMGDAIERRLGRTLLCTRGEEWVELGLDSRDDDGEGERYMRFKGGSLY